MGGIAALGLLGLAVGSAVWLACSWRAERTRRRHLQLRWALEDAANTARRRREAEQVRTTLEELQTTVRAAAAERVERRVQLTSSRCVRVLTPARRAIDIDLRLLEGLDDLTYDPAIWER